MDQASDKNIITKNSMVQMFGCENDKETELNNSNFDIATNKKIIINKISELIK